MTQHRKTSGPDAAPVRGARPLSARSVVASTLLGMDPPRLSGQLLVRSGELFGISEGTTRVALSRMVAAGELEADGGAYRLAGRLLARQQRQAASRRAERGRWDGRWVLAVVGPERRSAADRAALRDAMRQLHLAELREGVWLRPDNLGAPADRAAAAATVVAAQCRSFQGAAPVGADPAALAAELWDLAGWAHEARALRGAMAEIVDDLVAGDTGSLAPAFVLSAAVLRHLLADPVLPVDLLPRDWPGPALRADYDRYDAAFKSTWRAWFRNQT